MPAVTRQFVQHLLIAAACAVGGGPALAQNVGAYGRAPKPGEPSPEAEIAMTIPVDVQRKVLGTIPPLDGTFYDHENAAVTLRQLVGDKPTILVPAYFLCPKLCNEVLANLVDALGRMRDADPRYAIGKKFNVVIFSIDAREDYTLSGPKRLFTLKQYDDGREPTRSGLWYVTASDRTVGQKAKAEGTIRVLTDAIGFPFKMDKRGKDIQHPGAAVVLAPDGRVSAYYTNIMFRPDDLKRSIDEAAGGNVGAPDPQSSSLYCMTYDQVKPIYALIMLITAGVAAPVGLLTIGLVVRSMIRAKHEKQAAAAGPTSHA